MLKSNVGSSTAPDAGVAGKEAAAKAKNGLADIKVAFSYASVAYVLDKMLAGIATELPGVPVIGNTSFTGVITPEGFIGSDDGFVGVMAFADETLAVGVAGSPKDGDARSIGRKVALVAMKKAGKNTAPDYISIWRRRRARKNFT